jgi:D-methionine transport system permease protein
MLHDLLNALEETLFMVFSAGLLTWLIGLPLGALLYATKPARFLESKIIYSSLHFLIGTSRSIPYIAFTIALIPLTRMIVGSDEGSLAAIIPLTLAAIPHFAQLCEKALSRVSPGLIEAAKSLSATPLQIIYKILIPEALPNIIQGLTITLVHLIGYSTIAGALGGGGLGYLLIYRGYQNFQPNYVVSTLALLIVLVQIIQLCGNYIASGTAEVNSYPNND